MSADRPQLILYLDYGEIRAELPGLNGTPRRKLDLVPGEIEHQIRAALLDEQDRLRDEARRKTEALQRENIRTFLSQQSSPDQKFDDRFLGGDFLILTDGSASPQNFHAAAATVAARNIWGETAVEKATRSWSNLGRKQFEPAADLPKGRQSPAKSKTKTETLLPLDDLDQLLS